MYVPEDLHERIRMSAAKQRLSLSEWLRAAAEAHLAGADQPKLSEIPELPKRTPKVLIGTNGTIRPLACELEAFGQGYVPPLPEAPPPLPAASVLDDLCEEVRDAHDMCMKFPTNPTLSGLLDAAVGRLRAEVRTGRNSPLALGYLAEYDAGWDDTSFGRAKEGRVPMEQDL